MLPFLLLSGDAKAILVNYVAWMNENYNKIFHNSKNVERYGYFLLESLVQNFGTNTSSLAAFCLKIMTRISKVIAKTDLQLREKEET